MPGSWCSAVRQAEMVSKFIAVSGIDVPAATSAQRMQYGGFALP